jgi:hypothetical protein
MQAARGRPNNMRDPSEKSIIAVLGLIYVTVRTIAISQALATAE